MRERKTASAMGERQMLPRQTKRTDTGGGAIVVVAAAPFCRLFFTVEGGDP